MKALILSDLHGNINALEAIWRKEKDSDIVYCAGDLVDYGPFPREVTAWVREHDVQCVQGNHDAWVVKHYREGKTLEAVPVDERGWVNFTVSALEGNDICFLEGMPTALAFELDGAAYGLVHRYRDYEEIVSLSAFARFRAETFDHATSPDVSRMIMGHTHRQSIRYLADTILWLNPGSVSYRRKDDLDQSAHYAIITDGKISLRRLTYDLAPVYDSAMRLRLMKPEMEFSYFSFGPR